MDHEKTGPLQELHDEISIGNNVHRVFSNSLEAEFGAKELSVETVGVPSQGSSTEGQDRDSGDEAV